MLTSFLGWVLRTVHTAAEAEMNDESHLREALLDAEMRRETGELSEEEFRQVEADVLGRMREIRDRRTGGAGALTMTGDAADSTRGRYEVEASMTGDFHRPLDAASEGGTPSPADQKPARSRATSHGRPRRGRRVRHVTGARQR